MSFPGKMRHNIPFGVDNHERRPSAGGVGLPGGEFRVVEYGVFDVVAVYGCGKRYRVCLMLEFGAVHAHGDEHIREFFFEGAQLVKHVQAVNAAQGPEVEDHDFAAKSLQV